MSETRDLIDMHYAAFNERDFSKTSQIYSTDVVTIEPGSGRMEGPDAVVAHAQVFLTGFPDARLEVLTVVDDGQRVAIEGLFVGTNTGPLQSPQRRAAAHRTALAAALLGPVGVRSRPHHQAPGLLRPDDLPRPARARPSTRGSLTRDRCLGQLTRRSRRRRRSARQAGRSPRSCGRDPSQRGTAGRRRQGRRAARLRIRVI